MSEFEENDVFLIGKRWNKKEFKNSLPNQIKVLPLWCLTLSIGRRKPAKSYR